MSSEGNQVNDGMSFQPSESPPCANGCGFFGTAATMNLCSKCYRDLLIKEEQAALAKSTVEKLVAQNQKQNQTDAVDGLSVQGCSSTSVGDSSPPSSFANVKSAAGVKVSNRCPCCNKKVGVMGFKCKCGSVFCGKHRFLEEHGCIFDFKALGRHHIAMANPVVKADKVKRF